MFLMPNALVGGLNSPVSYSFSSIGCNTEYKNYLSECKFGRKMTCLQYKVERFCLTQLCNYRKDISSKFGLYIESLVFTTTYILKLTVTVLPKICKPF